VGQGHCRVAGARREEFRQGRRLRPGNAGQRHDEDEQQDDDHRRIGHRQRTVVQQALKNREDGQCAADQSGQQDRSAADPVGQPAAEQRCGKEGERCDHDHEARFGRRQLDHGPEKDAAIDLGGKEQQRATGRNAEEQQRHAPQCMAVAEALAQRGFGQRVFLAQAAEYRRFVQIHPAADRNGEQHGGQQEGNAPAPGPEIGVAQHLLQDDDLQRRGHHAERPHQLQHAGIEAAPAFRRVFGEVHRGAADLAADRQPLQHAQHQQQGGGEQADLLVSRQQADEHGRDAHQDDGDEEDGAPSVAVAERAEQRGAERADDHADAEGAEAGEQGGDRVVGGEEEDAEIDRQRSEGQEVVPFQKGAETGGDHDLLLDFLRTFWRSHGGGGGRKTAIIARRAPGSNRPNRRSSPP